MDGPIRITKELEGRVFPELINDAQRTAILTGGNVPEYAMTDPTDSVWIIEKDDKGWIFVGNGIAPHDEEGNGVWMDPDGKWQFGTNVALDSDGRIAGFVHGAI